MKHKWLLFIFPALSAMVTCAQPGALDSTFGIHGILTTDSATFFTSAVQRDGKLLVAGATRLTAFAGFAIARYTSNGKPDSSFSEDGFQTTYFGFAGTAFATALVIQDDGKIVVAGSGSFNGNNYDFALARYHSNGEADSSFSKDGKEIYNIGSTYTSVTSAALQQDGKIVVAGYSTAAGADHADFTLARFSTDGSLDKSFSGDGKQTTDFGKGEDDIIFSVVVQPDGKIVAAGQTGDYIHNYFAIARYTKNGAPDPAFSGDGKQTTDFGFSANGYSLVIQSDGKMIVAGQVLNKPYDFALARYNTNGTHDHTFGNDGKQVTSFGYESEASAVVVQRDGKIIAGGNVRLGSTRVESFALARYNPDGMLDKSFGADGRQITAVTPGDNHIFSLTIEGDRLYAVGTGSVDRFSPFFGVVAAYSLHDINPLITLETPIDLATYLAGGNVYLTAAATAAVREISKVEFYNGNMRLHTSTVAPYDFKWQKVNKGNYTLTAKATGYNGMVTTSAPVHISVVLNTPPAVRIISPVKDQILTAPASIYFEAVASDSDGRVTAVEFYNGSTLLALERKLPYTYYWANVPAGSYSITAVATDNWGAASVSAPVAVTVLPNTLPVSSKPSGIDKITDPDNQITVRAPQQAKDIMNMFATGVSQLKETALSLFPAWVVYMNTFQKKTDKIEKCRLMFKTL